MESEVMKQLLPAKSRGLILLIAGDAVQIRGNMGQHADNSGSDYWHGLNAVGGVVHDAGIVDQDMSGLPDCGFPVNAKPYRL